MKRLVIRWGDQARFFALPSKRACVGTAPDNDIVVPATGVSRLHAFVEPGPGGFVLVDADSKNGLWVDGNRKDQFPLRPGMSVSLGNASLCLEEASTGDANLAVDLHCEYSSQPSAPSTTASGAKEVANQESPAAALSLVREIENSGDAWPRRQQWLARVRKVLGARAIALLDLCETASPTVITISGSFPEGITLSQLNEDHDDNGTLVIIRAVGSGTRQLWAIHERVLDADAKAWRSDLVDYIRAKLMVTVQESEPLVDTQTEERLRLPPEMLIGECPSVQSLLAELRAVVDTHLDVLLQGPTGTGKELYARLIHASGPSSTGPFVALNCAAIPRDLLEVQLFGVERGAYTGAERHEGLIRRAEGGSLFLDEIAELPVRLQPKILRALQEREVLPVGGRTPHQVSFRVIAATNLDLGEQVTNGRFRADLLFRLSSLQFNLPTLTDQFSDLPEFISTLVERAAAHFEKNVRGISFKALQMMLDYAWPGNFRELHNVINRAVLLCRNGEAIESRHLQQLNKISPLRATASPAYRAREVRSVSMQDRRRLIERELIEEAIRRAGGNKSRAAKDLRISRSTLYSRLRNDS